MPEQTLGGIPLCLGMVMKINFFEFSCTLVNANYSKRVYTRQLREYNCQREGNILVKPPLLPRIQWDILAKCHTRIATII